MDVIPGRPEDLPDFRKPPLAETVLSLQFEPVTGLTAAHVGLLWERFREKLPFLEEHPPLPPVFEKFDLPSQTKLEVTFEEKPPVPRTWFLNQEKTELIQVQPDRFIHNWRKVEGIEPYPRYERIRERFRSEVAILEAFLKDEGLGTPAMNQCEVTYVNHIEPPGTWEGHGRLENVLKNWSPLPTGSFLPEPEDGGVRLRFIIPGQAGKPIGRLNVLLQPAWRKTDKAPMFVLTLTARGEPLGQGVDGAFAFFDLGRRWIVKGFGDLTAVEMQKVWERIDG